MRIANAATPARLRRNGHGNGSATRCAHGERATALRRPPATGRARTHAGAAARRSNDSRPENGPRRPLSSICTGPGRRHAPTPSAVPEAVDTRTLACAWSSVNGGAEDRRNDTSVRLAAATRSAPGDRWARGATTTCACKLPRIGPPGSTSTTLANAANAVDWSARTLRHQDLEVQMVELDDQQQHRSAGRSLLLRLRLRACRCHRRHRYHALRGRCEIQRRRECRAHMNRVLGPGLVASWPRKTQDCRGRSGWALEPPGRAPLTAWNAATGASPSARPLRACAKANGDPGVES